MQLTLFESLKTKSKTLYNSRLCKFKQHPGIFSQELTFLCEMLVFVKKSVFDF
jgi:hypothetical protein